MKEWGLSSGRFRSSFSFYFLLFLFFLTSLPIKSFCQTTTKSNTVALSIPYPNKKHVDEILKGNDSPDTKARLKKINEDIKKLQKILPKDAKVMKAKVTKYSVEYRIECKFFIKRNADPMDTLLKFMEKFKELNYPEFVFLGLSSSPHYISNNEKIELTIYFTYKSGNFSRYKGFKRNGLPISLTKQIQILKILNSLNVDNFRICSIGFHKSTTSFFIHLRTTGKRNPLQTVSEFLERIRQKTDMKHSLIRMQDRAYTKEDIEGRLFIIVIEY